MYVFRLILIAILLQSCLAEGGPSRCYKFYDLKTNTLSQKILEESKQCTTPRPENVKYIRKQYYLYTLSYFVPLNFWILFYDDPKTFIKKAVQEANKEGIKGDIIENIIVSGGMIATPIISLGTTDIQGIIVE